MFTPLTPGTLTSNPLGSGSNSTAVPLITTLRTNPGNSPALSLPCRERGRDRAEVHERSVIETRQSKATTPSLKTTPFFPREKKSCLWRDLNL